MIASHVMQCRAIKMRYPQNRKAETRQKLIEKAGALAKKDGFATTGVDGLMASVGLTGGAFYSHF